MFAAFNILFLLAFVASALVQYNDPDALPWMLIYGAAALMCAAQYRKKPPRWLPLTVLVVSLAWSVALLPGVAGQVTPGELVESAGMRTLEIEQAREVGGLGLVALWSAVLVHRGGRRNDFTPPSGR